jgi:hypothetical protein
LILLLEQIKMQAVKLFCGLFNTLLRSAWRRSMTIQDLPKKAVKRGAVDGVLAGAGRIGPPAIMVGLKKQLGYIVNLRQNTLICQAMSTKPYGVVFPSHKNSQLV